MFIEQLSRFLENRPGKLKWIADALKEKNINIISLGLSDTTDYGIARMIVSDSARAKQVLLEKGYTAVLTPVLVVELQQEVGALSQILDTLSTKGLNLEYMYALVTGKEGGAMVVKTSDQALSLIHILIPIKVSIMLRCSTIICLAMANMSTSSRFSAVCFASIFTNSTPMISCLLYTSRCV